MLESAWWLNGQEGMEIRAPALLQCKLKNILSERDIKNAEPEWTEYSSKTILVQGRLPLEKIRQRTPNEPSMTGDLFRAVDRGPFPAHMINVIYNIFA
jgi:hypothetical protein